MNKFIKIFLLFLPVTIFATTPAQQLEKLLSGLHTMQANFNQNKITGKMAIKRPGKFLWQTISPNKQLILANGKYLWIYDADLKQATKTKINAQQPNNPVMLLSGSVHDLQSQFNIKQQGAWFLLSPKSKNAMLQQVQLCFSNSKLIAMRMADNLGQKSTIRFTNIKINKELPINLFIFKPPSDTDVVNISHHTKEE